MGLTDTFFNGPVLAEAWPLLLDGLLVTVLLGATSIVIGTASGLALALVRTYASRAWRLASVAYIDVFRSMPLLVLLTLVYYALPFVGVRLSSFAAAATSLSLVACAYTAEIFRAGIEALPRGQTEAAQSLGLRPTKRFVHVILPQALRIVLPPLTSNCINVLKDTALASVVAMPELLKQATQAQAVAANPTPLVGAAVLYLLLLLPLVRLVGIVGERQQRQRR